MSFDSSNIERKVVAILKILHSLGEPAGSLVIARNLKEQGIDLSERAVRYHLKLMDERGLTSLVGNRDGRVITEKGQAEIRSALVKDKVGFTNTRIEALTYRSTFNAQTKTGLVPLNVSIFSKSNFNRALPVIKKVFESGLTASPLVAIAEGGQTIGDVAVPSGKMGLGTVCSIIVNGALLKAGIPMDSRFGGLLQMENHNPRRFVEIIHYNGCSLDPSEIFIKAGMTSVQHASSTGSGEVLANFREIPSICLPVAERVLRDLKLARLDCVAVKGQPSEAACEISVEPNKVGIVLLGGLNPVAAAHEAGLPSESKSMATVIEYRNLIDFNGYIQNHS